MALVVLSCAVIHRGEILGAGSTQDIAEDLAADWVARGLATAWAVAPTASPSVEPDPTATVSEPSDPDTAPRAPKKNRATRAHES